MFVYVHRPPTRLVIVGAVHVAQVLSSMARAAGFGWKTVRAIMTARPDLKSSGQSLDAARENFERLTAATAQRVVRFWQVRQGSGE